MATSVCNHTQCSMYRCQSKYGDKKSYNNVPPTADEELAHILVTKELLKDKSIDSDNMET